MNILCHATQKGEAEEVAEGGDPPYWGLRCRFARDMSGCVRRLR